MTNAQWVIVLATALAAVLLLILIAPYAAPSLTIRYSPFLSQVIKAYSRDQNSLYRKEYLTRIEESPEKALSATLEAIQNSDHKIRSAGQEGLRRLAVNDKVRPAIIASRKKSPVLQQKYIISVYAWLDDEQSFIDLASIVSAESNSPSELRVSAVISLGMRGGDKEREALNKVVEFESDNFVLENAKSALSQIEKKTNR